MNKKKQKTDVTNNKDIKDCTQEINIIDCIANTSKIENIDADSLNQRENWRALGNEPKKQKLTYLDPGPPQWVSTLACWRGLRSHPDPPV